MLKFALPALLFILSLNTSAQTYGGIKGGLNINDMIITSNQADQVAESASSYLSFHAGSFVQNNFSDHFGWRIEMLFSNKGYYRKIEDQKINVSLNYLNWPLLLVYSSGSKLDLEAGIELGYLVSGEERFNSFDMGMDIGARYDLTERINIGLRYNLGFPFQFKSGDLDFEANQSSYQQSVLQFSIGYNLIREIKADN